jgi:hypothetical protein
LQSYATYNISTLSKIFIVTDMYFNRLLTDYQEGTGSFLSIQSMMIRSVTRRQTRRHFVRNSINRQGRRRAYKRKVRACWRRLYCREIVISITYSECVFVALGIQHEMRMLPVVISVLPSCTVFFHVT